MNKNRGVWRGKLIDEDEQLDRNKWVEGFLAKRTKSFAKIVDDEDIVRYVDPETLGECTGQPDKNHKIIFEGDIVTTTLFNTPDKKYVIKYDVSFAAFICVDISNESYFTTFDGDSNMFEVVGNIFENPELLKEGESDV